MKIIKSILLGLCFLVCLEGFGQNNEAIQAAYTKELSKLINQKKVKQAFKIIDSNDEQTIKDMIALTEVIAPPFKESERAAMFKKMLDAAGADKVWIDEVGNVLALR